MKTRWFFVCLLLSIATTTLGEGRYQRTRDGRTLVWNNAPETGQIATWSGRRDKDGYATGPGTVTWYVFERTLVTGSNIAGARYTAISRYSGRMVHGKFEGASGETEEKPSHGKVSGASKAAAGKTVEKPTADRPNEAPQAAKPQMVVSPPKVQEVPSPAPPKPEASAPAEIPVQATPAPTPSPTQTPRAISDSLRLLTSPPSSLGTSPQPSPEASAPENEPSPSPPSNLL